MTIKDLRALRFLPANTNHADFETFVATLRSAAFHDYINKAAVVISGPRGLIRNSVHEHRDGLVYGIV